MLGMGWRKWDTQRVGNVLEMKSWNGMRTSQNGASAKPVYVRGLEMDDLKLKGIYSNKMKEWWRQKSMKSWWMGWIVWKLMT